MAFEDEPTPEELSQIEQAQNVITPEEAAESDSALYEKDPFRAKMMSELAAIRSPHTGNTLKHRPPRKPPAEDDLQDLE